MKRFIKITATTAIVILTGLVSLTSCSNDDDTDQITNSIVLTQADKDALLFMLEEEKLARDTYEYLDNLWSINQFGNIKNSEQSHMNLVANLLTQSNVPFEILPYGEFTNTEIQTLYDQFVVDGSISMNNALTIGATIEDLDIRDLQDYIDVTSNVALISVFENLQCGSRNHLRSFFTAIENSGENYVPQYISQEQFDTIVTSGSEQCN
ncbi:DUF2202 domain-containing protein [Nonlabens sp. Ci31]|jgi:hypothetical protein|uniref:DUF2202 domain-containing protein n=1 Tax=Nonlabens sp. Ci31 TaxID=2608253 RepID=UPI0014646620|nr:DUF2202 domain-containing protein [Nonlabens sp. Ci31]QJP34708.1 DUF2202 domain-containing protein [Nonlabens sp. Ci31]